MNVFTYFGPFLDLCEPFSFHNCLLLYSYRIRLLSASEINKMERCSDGFTSEANGSCWCYLFTLWSVSGLRGLRKPVDLSRSDPWPVKGYMCVFACAPVIWRNRRGLSAILVFSVRTVRVHIQSIFTLYIHSGGQKFAYTLHGHGFSQIFHYFSWQNWLVSWYWLGI